MPSSAALTLEPPASMAAEYMNGIKVISEGLDSTSGMLLHEKEGLLSAAKQLVDKLEGPETGIWKVVFGVSKRLSLVHHE